MPLRRALAVVALAAQAVAVPLPAATQTAPVAVGLAPSDPCAFFRGRAWGQGIAHYTTEMLWACEAIAVRHAAAMPLSERLRETEAALDRFRDAVVLAGGAAFERSRRLQLRYLGVSPADEREIAERVGVLAALDDIRAGF